MLSIFEWPLKTGFTVLPLLRPAFHIIMKHTARANESIIFMSQFTCLLQMLLLSVISKRIRKLLYTVNVLKFEYFYFV